MENSNIVERLNTQITHPVLIKLSKKGMWEQAWKIPYEQGIPSDDDVRNYVHQGPDDTIAVQISFIDTSNANISLGIRYSSELRINGHFEFVKVVLDSLKESPNSFNQFVEKINNGLHLEQPLFSINPTQVEIGVIGYWKSLGATAIWSPEEEKVMTAELLEEKLKGKDSLKKNDKNYPALEFNYRTVPHHWIGIECSKKEEELFLLDQERVRRLLHEYYNFSI